MNDDGISGTTRMPGDTNTPGEMGDIAANEFKLDQPMRKASGIFTASRAKRSGKVGVERDMA